MPYAQTKKLGRAARRSGAISLEQHILKMRDEKVYEFKESPWPNINALKMTGAQWKEWLKQFDQPKPNE
jgi:hypothetical protein